MKTLTDVKNNFDENLKMVDQIVNIGSDVGNLAVNFLEGLEKQNEALSGFIPYKQKLGIVIQTIKDIKDAPQIKSKYEIILNQALVLVVENFESFLNDCVKVIINCYPGIIEWPEKKKILPVNVDVLRYSSPTVGDLVMASLKGEINFQDLQSTLRFFKDYLKIDFDLKNKDNIIFAQALRNIIVHNSNTVDHGFLSQIRNTGYAEKFKDKERIMLSEIKYRELLGDFSGFSEKIIKELKSKIEIEP
ncbi:MAG: hypothetical protein WC726_00100 [Parcubacteria group bacterium]|jgi:hypothetical protein